MNSLAPLNTKQTEYIKQNEVRHYLPCFVLHFRRKNERNMEKSK